MKRLYISPIFRSVGKQKVITALIECAKKHNYEIVNFSTIPKDMTENDVLVIWNRHARQDHFAKAFERVKAKVLVLENAYIKLRRADRFVSIGYGWHNNIKFAPKLMDRGERWESFEIDLKPWQEKGEHILIATQAKMLDWPGLGHESYRQPGGWDSRICQLTRAMSKRPILFRQHPNGHSDKIKYEPLKKVKNLTISDGSKPIKNDLRKAWCSVLHTSNAATESLINGVPVFYTGPDIYLSQLCHKEISMIEKPFRSDERENYFKRMAWAQYSLSEISSGFFFDVVL
jgi:hypothetical protein